LKCALVARIPVCPATLEDTCWNVHFELGAHFDILKYVLWARSSFCKNNLL
jgi:hypothetical protein